MSFSRPNILEKGAGSRDYDQATFVKTPKGTAHATRFDAYLGESREIFGVEQCIEAKAGY